MKEIGQSQNVVTSLYRRNDEHTHRSLEKQAKGFKNWFEFDFIFWLFIKYQRISFACEYCTS